MVKVQKGKQRVIVEHNIEVGMHASGTYWTDWNPFEVIKVSPSGKTITIRELKAVPTANYNYLSNQEHTFESDPEGRTYTVRYTQRGWRTPCNMRVSFGYARSYRDPQF